jgi:hypothetical protein
VPATITRVPDTERTVRLEINELRSGWNTDYPHVIPDDALYVADNVVLFQDGLISKRPGNLYYGQGGGGNGKTGSGSPILGMTRFYPGPVGTTAPQLIVHSGTKLYKGTDATGAFAAIGASNPTASRGCTFEQMRDLDMTSGNAVGLFVCDGVNIPHVYDGVNYVAVQTGGNFLPTNANTGQPITPRFCLNWGEHMVYSGDPNDPCGVWISDAGRPERFTAFSLTDSGGVSYTAYYPGGADGRMGPVTGIGLVGPFLVVFHFQGVVAGINTGTYGATQYQWATISPGTGCCASKSIVSFDTFLVFFGGNRFYATDGQSVVPLPDRVQSVYSTSSTSAFPSEMVATSKPSVAGVRSGTRYWAAYDAIGTGQNNRVAVFDFGANGGWAYGSKSGGAWTRWPTGMPVSCGIECRGPGDAFQTFWGSSTGDLVAQHDAGTFGDFGAAITCEIRAKAFLIDSACKPKTIECLRIVGVYPTSGATYTDNLTGYVVLDLANSVAPGVAVGIAPSGTPYGSLQYGTFKYGASQQIIEMTTPTYPQREMIGNFVEPGVIESSTNPFNVLGFIVDAIVDNPIP